MSGHLFVVHGRMEMLGWDAAVIPTDSVFQVEPQWEQLWPGRRTADLRPELWRLGAAERAGTGEALWFLDVAQGTVGDVAAQARTVVERIAAAEPAVTAGPGRARPLVVMPVLASGRGGFDQDRGTLLDALLSAVEDALLHVDLDVAIVAANPSAYSALQAIRRERGARWLDAERAEEAERLGRAAAQGELALFLGAGVSMSSGLPSWGTLLDVLGEGVDMRGLGPLDQAELLARRFAREPQAGPGGRGSIGSRVVGAIRADAVPSLTHALLASLGAREAVTTNYDRLYEEAVAAAAGGRGVNDAISILPWARPAPDRPWILKMHGDLQRPESIVLTRSDFVRYDSTWRPVGAVLQYLMLAKHLLVVGASLKDDNLLRLAHEVMAFRNAHVSSPPPIGTVLALERSGAAADLWRGELDHVAVSDVTMPERDAGSVDVEVAHARAELESVRDLTIFLDAVAVHASSDASYLADDRYVGMLSEDEQALAEDVRALYTRARNLRHGPRPWIELTDALERFGAHEPR